MKQSFKILLIEPDSSLAQKMIKWLSEYFDPIVHLTNHNEIQNQVAEKEWDLVITDVQSKKVNNLDITKIVKNTNATTAILIITENIKVDFILRAMEYHANALLFKPLDKKEFINRVLQLAEESKNTKIKKGNKVVLAIGAHPDDVEFGCAGTLAKLRENKAQINILTLSLGAVGGNPELRKKESEQAAKLQKARLFLGNLEDTRMSETADTIYCIEQIVKEVQPTHIYTHSLYDNHQDHRAICQATIIACRQVPNIFCYLSPSSTVDFKPNVFIDIDDYIETKLKIIAVFKSQASSRPYLEPDLIRATARYWGRFCNYHLAEPMEVLKEHS